MNDLKRFFPANRIPPEIITIDPGKKEINRNLNWLQDFENVISQTCLLKNVLLIVNDAQRSTPTAKILEKLDQLDNQFSNKCSVLIATGSHAQPTDGEIKQILGKFIPKQLVIHQAKQSKQLVKFGTTTRQNEIWLNKLINNTDLIITINSIEPHYFAGFTGGRKSFLPGVAGYQSIEKNHQFALDPRAKSLNLNDNPVHQDMTEALKFVQTPVQTIQMVTFEHNIIDIFCGDIESSFTRGVELARKLYSIPVTHPADLVIVEVNEPFSHTLYQAQKALIHGSYAGAKGGEIIFLASCKMGLGSPAFYHLLSTFNTPQQVLDYTEENYKLGYHKAYHMARIAKKMKIYMISQLSGEVLSNMFMEKINNPTEKINQYINSGRKIIYLPNGEVTVPCITEG
ncbi:MAG: hypothetical protein APR63_03825 [Desulfuromonas sp. SDB]|nr:MAG: hypothetical protein APR63_03825 [Desulfuromonas sp. SDB]